MSEGDAKPTESSAAGPDFSRDLAAARSDLEKHLGPLLERHRQYLLAIALAELPAQLHGKVGASDLVQDTMVRGLAHFRRFEGQTQEQLACWMRQILVNHLRNVAKAYGTEKRDVAREEPVDRRIAIPQGLSPSREFLSREREASFQCALERLPEESRKAIELRHRENLSFARIGELLGKSEDTARRLWARAIEQLRVALAEDESRAP